MLRKYSYLENSGLLYIKSNFGVFYVRIYVVLLFLATLSLHKALSSTEIVYFVHLCQQNDRIT
jgi:hypothetical protein